MIPPTPTLAFPLHRMVMVDIYLHKTNNPPTSPLLSSPNLPHNIFNQSTNSPLSTIQILVLLQISLSNTLFLSFILLLSLCTFNHSCFVLLRPVSSSMNFFDHQVHGVHAHVAPQLPPQPVPQPVQAQQTAQQILGTVSYE